ncbi:MAG TPA: CHAT domain-containing protein [Myxococcaceae bacterium]
MSQPRTQSPGAIGSEVLRLQDGDSLCDLVALFMEGHLAPDLEESFRVHLGSCQRCRESIKLGLLVEGLAPRRRRVVPFLRSHGTPAALAALLLIGLGVRLTLGLTPVGLHHGTSASRGWVEGHFAEGPLEHAGQSTLSAGPSGEGAAYDEERWRIGWFFGQRRLLTAAASALHHRDPVRAEEALAALEASAAGDPEVMAKVYNDRAVLNLELAERLPAGSCEALARVQGAEAEQEGACDERMRLLREALASLQRSLERTPGRPAALFNRGLVLEQLGLKLSASAAFRAAAATAPEEWSRVANQTADQLAGSVKQDQFFIRRTGQVLGELSAAVSAAAERDAGAVSRAAIAVRGAVDHVAQLRNVDRDDEVVRMKVYELSRVGTAFQRRQLVPLAVALDGQGSPLARRLERYPPALAPDRAKRVERSLSYMGSTDEQRAQLLADLVRAGDVELAMGLLGQDPARAGRQEVAVPDGFLQQVQALEPYLAIRAGRIQARMALAANERDQAIQQLKALARSCPEAHAERCAQLESQLVWAYAALEHWSEAQSRAQRALALAGRSPSGLTRPLVLKLMEDIASAQNEPWLALAYAEEVLLAAAPDEDGKTSADLCYLASDALERMAAVRLFQLMDSGGALELLEKAMNVPGCDRSPLAEPGLDVLAALAAIGEAPPDWQDRLTDGVRALQQGKGHYLNAFIAAGAARVRNRAASTAALLQLAGTVDAAEVAGSPAEALERAKARSYAYRDLALEAGEAALAGDPAGYGRAFEMVARQLDLAPPKACGLAVVSYLGRTVAVARDERGATVGAMAKSRWRWVDRRGDLLVPASVQDALRDCHQVKVLASPGVFGLSRVLPGLPWSYAVAQKRPLAPPNGAPPRRPVLVANIEPPAALRLSQPDPLRTDDREPGTTVLQGREATRSRVIQALKTATELEVYGHGMQKPNDAEGSYLVLAPDPEEQNEFRLTGRDIPPLEGSPDVYLKSCFLANAGFQNAEAHSLASAFVERGARSVFAATVSIQDAGANSFFNEIRKLTRQGRAPAEALFEARASFRRDGHFQGWMDDVVCLEPA